MSQKTIESNQSGPKLPGATTPLFIKTKTTFIPDVNGNPIANTTKTELLYTPNGSQFFVAATSTKGGAAGSWELKKYTPAEIFETGISQYAQPDGTILGPTAAISLNTSGGIMYQAAQNSIKQAATSNGIVGGYQKPLASSLQNTAIPGSNPQPQAPQQGGANGPAPAQPVLPTPGESVGDLKTIDVPLEAAQLSIAPTSGLRYPKEMKTEQDKIKFQAVKIKPRAASGTGSQFSFGSPEYDIVDGPVCLSIQSPINDQNSVDWGPDSVSAIDAAIFNLSYTAMGPDGTPGADVESQIKNAYKEFITQSDRVKRYLAGQAASLNNVLARTDNVILNPNLELLFQAPQLRPFTFTFKMSARNQPEANDIKKIIKYFKYHMAVRKEKGIFLRAPHVFTIRYLKGETENHPGINLISPNPTTKACALTNCSVDYTPLGSYMTYNDGTMVSYTLNLQFQEITPVYDTDYDGHPIGY
jgi:hypothetical protein